MNDWKQVKLSDIIDFNPTERLPKGTTAKKVAMEKIEPFTRDIPEFELLEYKGGTKFRNGDTLMARITPSLENGKTAKVSLLGEGEIGFGSTEFIVARAKKGISDENFVYYLMLDPNVREVAIKSMVGTSGRQRVQLDVVKNYEILCPPLEKQIQIGRILSAIDDKIETNKKINHHLEQILQINLQKHLEKIKSKSRIGDLKLTISDHVANGSFKALKENVQLVEDKDYALFLRNIDLKNNLNGERRWVTKASYDFLKKSRLYGHEVIISNVADVGTVHRVPKLDTPMVVGNNVIFIQSEEKYLTDYFYVYFKSHFGQHDIISITSGSAQQKFNKTDFRKLEIPLLDKQIIVTQISPILHYIDNLKNETTILIQMRDSLLPKLLSGDISVDHATK